MNVDIIKAVVWAVITLALIGLLVKFWRADRQQVAKLKELEAFKERYRCEMISMYRWFASDPCTLFVLDWLDAQMVGGSLRPHGEARENVASHGVQAVRQAVRDSHFNDRCWGAAEATCAMPVPEQPSISQSQIADLRDACSEGVHPDLFMALCVNEMLRGRTLKVITERREHLNPLDGVSAPVVRQIVNDLGERVWPRDENVYATEPDGRVGEARHVEVVYQLVKPTVDEKVDEILKLMRQFGTGANDLVNVNMTGCASPELAAKVARDCLTLKARPLEQRALRQAARSAPVSKVERETIRAVFLRNGFTIKEGQTDLKPYVYAAAEELLSIARASWQRAQSAGVPEGWRLVPIKPTIEMVEAGYEESLGKPDRSGHARAIEMFDAMLAAAPAQGQQVEWRTTAVMLEQANAGLAQLNGKLRAELSALKAQQVGQEPVAWRVTGAGGLTVTPEYPKWAEDDSRLLIESLYTAPQPAPAQDVAGWIPVTERLPEVETDVLVRGVRRNEVMHRVAGLFNGEWSSQETEDLLLGEVTHWMPLPAAPAAHDKQSGVE